MSVASVSVGPGPKSPLGMTFSTPLPTPKVSSEIEQIFVNNQLEDVKKFEEKLRFDIERKKDHLRGIVGERYRDLIDSAELITKLSLTSKEILGNVSVLKTHLGDVSQSLNTDSVISKDLMEKPPSAVYDRLLLVIPEEICNNLDSCQPVDAALLYILAGDICAHLQLSNSSSVVSSKQTQTRLSRCKSSLIASCNSKLGMLTIPIQSSNSSIADIHNSKANSWLAAFIAIDYLKPERSYEKFLNCRFDKLKSITENSDSTHAVAEALHSYLSTAILTTSLFIDNRGAILSEIEDRVTKICPPSSALENEFVQFTLPHSIYPQLDKIVKHLAQSCQLGSFEGVDSSNIYSLLTDWLASSKEYLVPKIPELLQQNVQDIQSLQSLCEEISAVLNACCCQKYVPSVSEVWNNFFSEAVTTRFEEFIRQNFNQVQTNFRQNLETVEKEQTHLLWSAAKANAVLNWTKQMKTDSSQFGRNASELFVVAHFSGQQHSSGLQAAMASLDLLFNICKEFISSGLPLDLREAGFVKIRQEAYNFVTSLVEMNKNELEQHNSEKVSTDKLLNLSSLCFSTSFLFSYVQDWLNNPKFIVTGKAASTVKFSDPIFWSNSRSALHKICVDAFQVAANVFIENNLKKTFTNLLADSLRTDKKEASKCHEMVWFSVDIEEEGDDGQKFTSKISVPQQPSLNICSFVSSLCRFACMSPAFLLRQNNLNVIIFSTIIDYYNELISAVKSKIENEDGVDSPCPLSEDCAIQHLFDFQFLSSVFIGDYRRSQQFSSQCIDIVHGLESFIDPFDLNTVQPHLVESVRKHSKSVQIVYGSILSADLASFRGGKAAATTPSRSDDHNILRLNPHQGRLTALSIPFSQAQLHPA